jgi:hypothetical protein
MSITFPRTDVMSVDMAPGKPPRLVSRQELSRQANGITRGKDLGSAIWMIDFSTVPLDNDDAVAYEALLNSLDGVINGFEAYDIRRPYPAAYPDGNFIDSGTIFTIGSDNKSIRLKTLPANFALSVGDYFSFDYGSSPSSRAYHQVVEAITASGAGTTAAFEVRPHFRSPELLTPSPAIPVTFKRPAGIFNLMPGSVDPVHVGPVHSSVAFSAYQSL